MNIIRKILEKKRLIKRLNNESGIILLVVLWTLVILTSLAMSLGRNTNIELSLTKYAVAKTKAKYFAWGGLQYAKEVLSADLNSDEFKSKDTLFACGVAVDEGTIEDVFKEKEIGDGQFSIGYKRTNDLDESEYVYGFTDEERLLNLNGLGVKDINVFKELIVSFGFDTELATTIANSTADWVDSDNNVSNEPYGAEDDYYMNLSKPYHVKNFAFDAKEELLLVRGMTEEIYDAIKDYVTIFPKTLGLKINFSTASKQVLTALFMALSANTPTAGSEEVSSLVDKLIEYRSGDDGIPFTEDDRKVDQEFANELLASERVIYLMSSNYQAKQSQFYRMRISAKEKNRSIQTDVEAVINRNDMTLLYWNRI